ncbi:MAG: hypothetical protein Q8Q42_02825 [Nanoarchaeota archaeon]|nr:hypothetical protein [Nanoarchaeota archaeon]
MKTKRGVSPVLATTILIGFAVVVTSVVMLFGGDLIENVKEKQGANIERTLECDLLSFKVTGVDGNKIIVSNDGQEDIYAFFIRYQGSEAEAVDSHHKQTIVQGGTGTIIAANSPGIGDLEKVKIFAKSVAGSKGNAIWGTCGQTETTVKF